MDVIKIWGFISNYAIGTNVCSLPTAYFVEGTEPIIGQRNGSVTSEETNINKNDSNANIPSSNWNNENQTDDEYDETESKDCNENEGETNKRKRIQRTRYLREEYRCSSCKYTCTTENAFLRHLRKCNVNQNDNPKLSCPICGKDRKSEESLDIHMKGHKDDKYFCCDICKFRTLQLKKLIQHRRMHTGEKPHLCPFCQYRSSRRDNLRSHVRRVHKKDLNSDTFTPRNMYITPSKKETV